MREHAAESWGGIAKPRNAKGPVGGADVDDSALCHGRGGEKLLICLPCAGLSSLSLLQGANETTTALESLVEAGAGLDAGLSVGPFGAVVAVTPLFTACEEGNLPSVEAMVAL